jgi:hypothetical protein
MRIAFIGYSLLLSISSLTILLAEHPERPIRTPSRLWHTVSTADGRVVCDSIHESGMRENLRLLLKAKDSAPRARSGFKNEPAAFVNYSDIEVDYIGFTPEAEKAFQRAVEIWSSYLDADVTIWILARFEEFGSGSQQIGSAQTVEHWKFEDESFWTPSALADQKYGEDLDPEAYDIMASFASDFKDWYFGTDGNPPEDKIDFVTVVLHELGHGLGFESSFRVDEAGNGYYGIEAENIQGGPYGTAYDQFIVDARDYTHTGRHWELIDRDKFSPAQLKEALTSNEIYFLAPISHLANGQRPIPLYTPTSFTTVSSVSHLNDYAYLGSSRGTLMKAGIVWGQSNHFPGDITLGILADLEWTVLFTKELAQFADGSGFNCDVVVTNPFAEKTVNGEVNFFDGDGNDLYPAEFVEGLNSWAVFELSPLGSVTFSTRGLSNPMLIGSVEVVSTLPVSAVIRFDFPGTGVAGVGSSEPAREVIVPVRRKGNLDTGIAIRNVGLEDIQVECKLRTETGAVILYGETLVDIKAGGRVAKFVSELFPGAKLGDSRWTLTLRASSGLISVLGVELENGARFTTLPVHPVH